MPFPIRLRSEKKKDTIVPMRCNSFRWKHRCEVYTSYTPYVHVHRNNTKTCSTNGSHEMLEVNAIDLYRSLEISCYSFVCPIYVLHYILSFTMEKREPAAAGGSLFSCPRLVTSKVASNFLSGKKSRHFTKVTFILKFAVK